MARRAYHEAVGRTAEEAVAEGSLAWAAIEGRVSIVSRVSTAPREGLATLGGRAPPQQPLFSA